MFYNPFAFLFIGLFVFGLLFLFVLVQINLIVIAFSEIGIPSQHIFLALFATLIGSFINIPVKKVPQQAMAQEAFVRYMGIRYRLPVRRRQETILTLNLGGAVIPVLLSGYLLMKTDIWIQAVVATAFMTLVTYKLARPVRGLGIALPPFAPPILAALVSVIIAYHHAPALAYISGTLGTLIGADILNLKKISQLGAPVASIGGAGTFDGIFLNGILAVLLAALIA